MPDDLQEPMPMQSAQRFPPPPAPWSPPVARTVTPPGGGGFSNPAYQDQLEAEQMQIYRQAKNVQQAEKDVASARRMLGILKADREIASGVPVDKAMYNNLPFLVPPNAAGALGAYRNLKPVPPPYQQNFQVGTNQVPAVITPGPGGAQRTQFIPRTSLPTPAFKASIEDIGEGVRAAKLGPHHYQLLERPGMRGAPTMAEKVQMDIWKRNLDQLHRAKAKTPIPQDQQKIQAQIDAIEQQMLSSVGRGAPEAPGPTVPTMRKPLPQSEERVKVRKNGKVGTIPRSQLEAALDEGYEEVKGK